MGNTQGGWHAGGHRGAFPDTRGRNAIATHIRLVKQFHPTPVRTQSKHPCPGKLPSTCARECCDSIRWRRLLSPLTDPFVSLAWLGTYIHQGRSFQWKPQLQPILGRFARDLLLFSSSHEIVHLERWGWLIILASQGRRGCTIYFYSSSPSSSTHVLTFSEPRRLVFYISSTLYRSSRFIST
ncbi:hypothetical protein BCR34DRAFT_227836 [Clohesyomyces aquaticus]|uniref:Uncharacterized protein n=1 Tax=Clohesyomyces aquaticus TaxID=1231657 RepID=A0A1Y1ZXM1_9PLEO|nr:hypothetical protein BCR34DRAFT_227836 [Clohesyomyces aquaticus]